MVIESFSEEETKNIAFKIGKEAKSSQIYCLIGDLGVGKTIFTKGFAEGLGIDDYITSPTFTIINEYTNANIPFYHFDVYRLSSPDEIYDLGYEEYFYGEGICLIEWADIISEYIPKDAIWITIKKDLHKDDNYRLIEVQNENISY